MKVAMSRDSKQGKDPKSQRTQGNPRRRRRNYGEPNWYDRAVNADYQEEVMQIPKDKAGLIIGAKGWRKKEIMNESGVKELIIREDQVHLRGTEEQCSNAKKIIDRILKGEDSWKKLDFIPKKYMGKVIGRSYAQLTQIKDDTGAEFKTDPKSNQDGALYIRGPIESQKRAIRKIKEIVLRSCFSKWYEKERSIKLRLLRIHNGGCFENLNLLHYNSALRDSQSRKRKVQLVHVDTTQMDLDQDFELSRVQPQDDGNSDETIFELKPLEPPSQDMEDSPLGFTGIEKLRDKLLMVFENLHKEKEEERVIVDIWCHLGHAYITKVDEVDQEEGKSFTLEEIKEKLEDEQPDWRSILKGDLTKIEVKQIEKHLECRAAKEEVRYDFTFYTPSCRYVRVKVFLTEKDGGKQEGDEATSMTFSRSAPFKVRSVMAHAQTLPDEQGDSSQKPRFYMCCQTQQRMKADILMLSKKCDYRLFVKTSPLIGVVPRTPQAEEEDKILQSYLMGMKINEGQLTLPPVSERPDGFDLFYQRCSRRRIYEYGMHFKEDENTENSGAGAEGKEQFSLLVSKYQEKTVDAAETEACGFDGIATETDVHLHCEEWDRLLEEGDWEPKQIVAKLPTFLKFLRKIQSIVAPEVAATDTDSSSSAD